MVVLEPESPSPQARETFGRVKAELLAAGFTVKVASRGSENARKVLEESMARENASAAISIESEPGSPVAEVWISDRLTSKLSIRPVDTRGASEPPQLLAIRTIELLRASLLELRSPPPGAAMAASLPAPVDRLTAQSNGAERDSRASVATEKPRSLRQGFAIEAGAAGLLVVDPATPAIAPELRLSYGSPVGLGGRLTWIGPTLGPGIEGKLGRASISYELALAEIVYAPPVRGPFGFWWTAGTGALHLAARGELHDPRLERDGGSTAFAVSLGGGFAGRVTSHFAIGLEAFAVLTAPRVVIDMGDENVGSLGRPLLGATLGGLGLF